MRDKLRFRININMPPVGFYLDDCPKSRARRIVSVADDRMRIRPFTNFHAPPLPTPLATALEERFLFPKSPHCRADKSLLGNGNFLARRSNPRGFDCRRSALVITRCEIGRKVFARRFFTGGKRKSIHFPVGRKSSIANRNQRL